MKRMQVAAGLGVQAYEEIKRAILEGRLEAGSLTSVRVLSEELGISRTPVREALVDLAKDGLVVFERNRGVRICTLHTTDVEEIFELRLMIEVPAMRKAAARLDADSQAKLEDELEAMGENQDDEAAYYRHDEAFHHILLELGGNERLTVTVTGLRDQTRALPISNRNGGTPALSMLMGQRAEMLKAIVDGNADAAAEATAVHLETVRSLLLDLAEPSPEPTLAGA